MIGEPIDKTVGKPDTKSTLKSLGTCFVNVADDLLQKYQINAQLRLLYDNMKT